MPIADARQFVCDTVADPALQRPLLKAIAGLEAQIKDDQALLPFLHLPPVVYAAICGDEAPARPLVVATTLLFLGIDILDDLADGDLPGHWQGVSESEIQLVAATLLSCLPQRAIGQLAVPSDVKCRMLACLSDGLLKMSNGQMNDLRNKGKEFIRPEDVERSVEQKSGEEGALMAMLAALMAGAPEDVVLRYGEFGRALATGGQLATDCFDLFQAAHSKDLANGSRTLPIAIHLSRLQGEECNAFLARLNEARTDPGACDSIRRELRSNGVLRVCAIIVEIYCQKARDVIGGLPVSDTIQLKMRRMLDHVSFFPIKKGE